MERSPSRAVQQQTHRSTTVYILHLPIISVIGYLVLEQPRPESWAWLLITVLSTAAILVVALLIDTDKVDIGRSVWASAHYYCQRQFPQDDKV